MNTALLKEELIRDEGLRLKPYDDTRGNLTIGVGRNLKAKGISREEAYRLLDNDVEQAVSLLDQYLPWWRGMTEIRQRVLVNMTFNMGLDPHAHVGQRGLWEFQKTIKMLEVGNYDGAATEMLFSAWATQVGPRAIRLSDMMRKGV